MHEWLQSLPPKEREKERKIAFKNAMRIHIHTGNEDWKALAFSLRK